MLCAPLGTRSAPVVQLGTVGIEQRLGELVEEVAEPCRRARVITAEVAYANYGPTHQHGAAALHRPPSTAAFRLLVTARGVRFARVALNLRKLSTTALYRRSSRLLSEIRRGREEGCRRAWNPRLGSVVIARRRPCPPRRLSLHQRRFPDIPAPVGAQPGEQGAHGPSVHLSHAGSLQDLSG